MAINERLIDTEVAAAANGDGGTGNQEEGLILHLDANDVDSYDGDGDIWYDITNHEYTPAVDPAENFNTVLYTGNGSTNSITGVGFQPDLVWIKKRNASASHFIVNSLITDSNSGLYLMSDSTAAAPTNTTFTSFDDDGFTQDNSNLGNKLNDTYVAWCFKAGGAPTATNTATSGAMTANSVSIDGELQSAYTPSGSPTIYPEKMSVNTNLGFSIVKYTGTTGADDVAHGLDVAPDLVIAKTLEGSDSNSNWIVYASPLSGQRGALNLDISFAASTTHFRADPNSSVLKLSSHSSSNVNRNGEEHIAYCFASKRGVSKVGSYAGTGAAGNKVYTGFQPAWVMLKGAINSTSGWVIIDSERNDKYLQANTSGAEASLDIIDFNGDGFTFKGSDMNGSGATYIYLAFAAEKATSLIDDTDLELHLDADSFPQKGESGYSNTPSTWTDSSGNSYNGTITGATFDSELGNFLTFDGSGDTVKVVTDNSPSFISGTGDITAEGWFKIDNPSTGYVFAIGDNSANGAGIAFGVNPSGNLINVAGGTLKTDVTPLRGIGWFHATVTYSGTEVKNYINGDLTYSYTTTTKNFNQSDNRLWLGVYHNGAAGLIGNIGQFRVYSSALTADEIAQNYRFTKNDYPNGYNGTISGATFLPSDVSFDFDGSNDSVTLDGLRTSYKGSYSLWYNTSLSSTNFVILDSSGTSNTNLGLLIMFLYTDEIRLYIRGGNGSASVDLRTSADSTFFNNNWHHLVVTWDAIETNTSKIYVDGNLKATGGCSQNNWTTSNQSAYDVRLGSYVGGSSPYDGKISDVKAYDKVLTPAEVTALEAIGYNGIG